MAIGLPFLDEMLRTSVYAQEPAPPPRVLTMFFALGLPSPFQADSYVKPFSGHMQPLSAVAEKVSMVRGVYYRKGSNTTGNHARGSQTVFIGGEKTGASIDQVALSELHGGVSPTQIGTLVAGTYTRQDGNKRHIHSWIGPNQPTAQPMESPREVFERAFGSFIPPDDPGGGVDPELVKQARYARSVLDGAMEQYKYVTSDAFGLSQASKTKVNLHLERLRELERRIYDPDAPTVPPPAGCDPMDPGEFTHPEMVEIQKTVNNEGVTMDVNRWMELWHAMVDVYAMAIKCDVCRFGNIQFQSGGERIKLYGDYTAYGQTRSFSDQETTHEYWHGWKPGNDDERLMIDHMWLLMAEMTYYLQALDDPDYLDGNGKTVLDNALVLASTELGDGNPHNIEDVFHLVAGGNGALRLGQVIDVDAQATALYNAGLRAIGIDNRDMDGDAEAQGEVLDAILT